MSIERQTIKSYIEDVISSKPVPGGGTVSALTGAQGTALLAMVIALTVNKKYFAEYKEDDQETLKALATFYQAKTERLLELSTEDSAAYDGFLVALRLPKDSEEEKRKRHQAMQQAQTHAMDVPLYFARIAFQALEKALLVAKLGNPNAISDCAVGAMCLQLAVRGGVYNARINLPGLEDEALVANVNHECETLVDEAKRLVEEILATVETRLG